MGCQKYNEDQTKVWPHLWSLFGVKDQSEKGKATQSAYKRDENVFKHLKDDGNSNKMNWYIT